MYFLEEVTLILLDRSWSVAPGPARCVAGSRVQLVCSHGLIIATQAYFAEICKLIHHYQGRRYASSHLENELMVKFDS